MRIVVINHLTLDGVTQAPATADEDRRGGFEHGGWEVPYGDAVMMDALGFGPAAGASGGGSGAGLLFGRHTYQQFYGVWPARTDNPFSKVLNEMPKYVASRTLENPLPWANSHLLEGDAAVAVERLKAEPGGQLVVLGSAELVQTLMRARLVDEYLLLIHPLILGSGRRLFVDGGPLAKLELARVKTTPKGVIIASYRPTA